MQLANLLKASCIWVGCESPFLVDLPFMIYHLHHTSARGCSLKVQAGLQMQHIVNATIADTAIQPIAHLFILYIRNFTHINC